MDRRMRRTTAATTLGVAMVALAACGAPPWEAGGDTPEPTATQATFSPAPAPVPNDMSSGSTERELTAGAVTATVNYWSTLSMDQWTPTALKPVNMSMVTTVTPDDGQQVYLQQASMIAVPGNDTQSFTPLTAQIDQATVSPGYLVLSPYSYSQIFNVGEVPAEATFVTLQFAYDFLVQTTPTSKEYAKQSASDVVTVAIAGGGVTATEDPDAEG